MNDEAQLIARAAQEIAPAAVDFSSAVGQTRAGQELAEWLGDVVRYRRLGHQAKLLTRAAEKVRASGLPTVAVEDKLLRAVLDRGSLEDDGSMQERWANLLANAGIEQVAVHPSCPELLAQLTADEASALETLHKLAGPERRSHVFVTVPRSDLQLPPHSFANLVRLGLIGEIYGEAHELAFPGPGAAFELALPVPGEGDDVTGRSVYLTAFGLHLVAACTEPPPATE